MSLTWRPLLSLLLLAAAVPLGPAAAGEMRYTDSPMLAERIADKQIPSVSERLPKTPLVSDMLTRGRSIGRFGGEIRTLVSKARDLRYVTVNGYTRLVAYNERLELKPDILESVENEGTASSPSLSARGTNGDGQPFTTEDFRYYWEDVANNKELLPSGRRRLPPDRRQAAQGGLDRRTAHPLQLGQAEPALPPIARLAPAHLHLLAGPLPQEVPQAICRPGKARRPCKEAQADVLGSAPQQGRRSLRGRNIDMPVLDPWRIVTKSPAQRYIFERNPYFHRVDPKGQQLPYVDRITVDLASSGLMAAKANAGEVDLLARGLSMGDVPVLKAGEAMHNYRTLLGRSPEARHSRSIPT